MLKFVKGIMIMEKFTFIIVLSIIFFVICSLLVKLIKHDTWISFKLALKLALVNDAFPLFIGITSGVCTAILLCLARTN
jgi:uncharacterized membrane protein